MDKQDFINKFFLNDSENTRKIFFSLLDRIIAASGDRPLEQSLKEQSFVTKLFSLSNNDVVSRSQYFRIKRILEYLGEYLGIQIETPQRNDSLCNVDFKAYFASLKDAISFVDDQGANNIVGYNSSVGLVRIKSLVILAWLGLSRVEIASLKRQDISTDDQGCFVKVGEQKIYIDKDYHEILCLQRDLDYVMGYPGGHTYNYQKDNAFLIRKRNGEKMKEDEILPLFTSFNKASTGRHILSLQGLKQSAIYEKIYNDKNCDTIERIMKHMNTNKNLAYGQKKIYDAWVKKFKD